MLGCVGCGTCVVSSYHWDTYYYWQIFPYCSCCSGCCSGWWIFPQPSVSGTCPGQLLPGCGDRFQRAVCTWVQQPPLVTLMYSVQRFISRPMYVNKLVLSCLSLCLLPHGHSNGAARTMCHGQCAKSVEKCYMFSVWVLHRGLAKISNYVHRYTHPRGVSFTAPFWAWDDFRPL